MAAVYKVSLMQSLKVQKKLIVKLSINTLFCVFYQQWHVDIGSLYRAAGNVGKVRAGDWKRCLLNYDVIKVFTP